MRSKRTLQTLFFWIAVMLPVLALGSGQPDSLFKKANEQYAKAQAKMEELAPEKREKLKAILETIKVKWDQLIAHASE